MEHSITIALSVIAAAVAYIVKVVTDRRAKPSQKHSDKLADQRATIKLSEAERSHLAQVEAAHSRTQAIIEADSKELSRLVDDAFND